MTIICRLKNCSVSRYTFFHLKLFSSGMVMVLPPSQVSNIIGAFISYAPDACNHTTEYGVQIHVRHLELARPYSRPRLAQNTRLVRYTI